MHKWRGLLFVAIWVVQFTLLPSFSFAQPRLEGFRPGARALGFGGSLVVQARDPSAIFWNPAILSGFRDRELLISVNDPFEFNFVGLTQFLPLYGTIGLALSRIPTDSAGVDRGTFAWGVKILKRLSLGADFNLAKQSDDWFAHGGFAVFLGNPGVGALGCRWNEIPTPGILDRLNLGLAIRNIPIGGKLFDPSANFGLSYLFPTAGLLINTGHHIHNGEDTSHLGLGLEVFDAVTVFSGIEDLEFDKAAIGLSYTHDNFLFNISYAMDSERFALSFASRISPAPAMLAKPYHDYGFYLYRKGENGAALRELRKYLSFELPDSSTSTTRVLVKRIEAKLARDEITIDSLYADANKMLRRGKDSFDDAVSDLTRILELDPNNLKAQRRLVELKPYMDIYVKRTLNDGAKYLQEKEYQKAKESFEGVLLVEKNNQSALTNLARIEEVFSGLADEHFERGLDYYRQKNYVLAIEEFNLAQEYKPDFEDAAYYSSRAREKLMQARTRTQTLIATGDELERKGRYYDATKQFLQVLQLDPGNPNARNRIDKLRPRVERYVQNLYNEGLKQFGEKDFFKAQESFSTVLSIDPGYKDARTQLSRVRSAINDQITQNILSAENYVQKGEWQNALDSYSNVLSLDPQNSRATQGRQLAQTKLQVQTLIANGEARLNEQKFLEAINIFQKALERDPDNEKAKTSLNAAKEQMSKLIEKVFVEGINLYAQDNYQDAINKWNQVLKLDPNHKSALEYKQQAEERLQALRKIKK